MDTDIWKYLICIIPLIFSSIMFIILTVCVITHIRNGRDDETSEGQIFLVGILGALSVIFYIFSFTVMFLWG